MWQVTGTDSGMLQVLDETRDRLPEIFDMEDIRSRVAEPTPYIMVAIQVSTRHLISPPSSPQLSDCKQPIPRSRHTSQMSLLSVLKRSRRISMFCCILLLSV